VFIEDMTGLNIVSTNIVSTNIVSTNIVALRRIESCVRPAPVASAEPIVANAPEAVTRTQPEPFIVSTPFLRPVPPNWQVACGIYPRRGRFCRITKAFRRLIRVQLTMPA